MTCMVVAVTILQKTYIFPVFKTIVLLQMNLSSASIPKEHFKSTVIK